MDVGSVVFNIKVSVTLSSKGAQSYNYSELWVMLRYGLTLGASGLYTEEIRLRLGARQHQKEYSGTQIHVECPG